MVKKKTVLNSKMRDVLRILRKKGGAMSANEIAEETGFSYKTVTKYLIKMEELEIIIRRITDGKSKKS